MTAIDPQSKTKITSPSVYKGPMLEYRWSVVCESCKYFQMKLMRGEVGEDGDVSGLVGDLTKPGALYAVCGNCAAFIGPFDNAKFADAIAKADLDYAELVKRRMESERRNALSRPCYTCKDEGCEHGDKASDFEPECGGFCSCCEDGDCPCYEETYDEHYENNHRAELDLTTLIFTCPEGHVRPATMDELRRLREFKPFAGFSDLPQKWAVGPQKNLIGGYAR